MTDNTFSDADRERLAIIRSCIRLEITNAIAVARLGLQKRQVQKLKRAVEKYGDSGILHGNRSQTPWNATDAITKKAVISFLKKKDHRDFGPTFAQEKLAEEGINLHTQLRYTPALDSPPLMNSDEGAMSRP